MSLPVFRLCLLASLVQSCAPSLVQLVPGLLCLLLRLQDDGSVEVSSAAELKATNVYIKALEKKYGKNIKVRSGRNRMEQMPLPGVA